ncbi:MAG: glucosaminidase domain-containing protein [Bacteroidales bacterium]|nr:glucosaminidase domain-containing protein [Bacteroidales bacterium]
MRQRIFPALWMVLMMFPVKAQEGGPVSREEYIETFAYIAMKEMVRTGIPASITLAQACLESDNGNSRLAVKANNHFGIKCHDWTGRRVHQDDDQRNECFRRYKSPDESYADHSAFLATRSRYGFLFDYSPDDYKKWARGLKKAGYATNPRYDDHLIDIIEEYELYRYDRMVLAGEGIRTEGEDVYYAEASSRQIYTKNNIEYIIVQEGDTPESLRRELDLYRNELYRYNNLDEGAELEPGQLLYLQPKRRRAARGSEIHIVQEGETMQDISQMYGVKIKHLCKKNGLTEGDFLTEGTELYLRRSRLEPLLKIEPVEEEPPAEALRFQFEK